MIKKRKKSSRQDIIWDYGDSLAYADTPEEEEQVYREMHKELARLKEKW